MHFLYNLFNLHIICNPYIYYMYINYRNIIRIYYLIENCLIKYFHMFITPIQLILLHMLYFNVISQCMLTQDSCSI